MEGGVSIRIDYEKFKNDGVWDGLKGYITNSKLKSNEIIENYRSLWHIEKAFGMSKTDLKIRRLLTTGLEIGSKHIFASHSLLTAYIKN